MPDDFRIYQIQDPNTRNRQTVYQSLKRALREFFSGPVISWIPPCPYDKDHHLFFKGKDVIYWARIYYDPLTHSGLDAFDEEKEMMFRGLKEKCRIFVFFPSAARGVLESLRLQRQGSDLFPLTDEIRFYEYRFLWSPDHEGI
ncbi:MAG: hypothetical protein NC930_09650, partial [Candidatus Omnitrophica bacterium]|nr:hypothetical protein [Candidatus Omnitrophota bacterium]